MSPQTRNVFHKIQTYALIGIFFLLCLNFFQQMRQDAKIEANKKLMQSIEYDLTPSRLSDRIDSTNVARRINNIEYNLTPKRFKERLDSVYILKYGKKK